MSGSVSAPGDLTPMPSATVACWLASVAVDCVPGRREALGLDADDEDVGPDRLCRRRYAGDQAPAADGDYPAMTARSPNG